MKHTVIAFFALLLVMPLVALAANVDEFVAAKAQTTTDGFFVVPLELSNTKDLVALDIPLSFTEGAVLQKVEFTDRVKNFEFQAANIDNANRRVVIGLISMISRQVPDLPTGSGPILNLYFKLDPGVSSVTLTPIELSNPSHSLSMYYNDYSTGAPVVKVIRPEINLAEVSASGTGALPTSYGMSQNTPNPFNPTTNINYALPEAGQVRISVFNILGQNIKDLVDDYMEPGVHQVVWDGKDASGSSVASGVYFYKISAKDYSETKKMVLLK